MKRFKSDSLYFVLEMIDSGEMPERRAIHREDVLRDTLKHVRRPARLSQESPLCRALPRTAHVVRSQARKADPQSKSLSRTTA